MTFGATGLPRFFPKGQTGWANLSFHLKDLAADDTLGNAYQSKNKGGQPAEYKDWVANSHGNHPFRNCLRPV